MPIRRFFLFFLAYIFSLTFTYSQTDSDYLLVDDLRPFWKVKSSDSLLVPFLDQTDIRSIYFSIRPAQYQGSLIQLCGGSDHYLFINNQLFGHLSQSSCRFLDVDSLRSVTQGENIWFGIYSENLLTSEIKTLIVDRVQKKYEVSDAYNSAPKTRTIEKDNEILIMTLVLFGLILTIRASRYKLFVEYFSVIRAFNLRQKSDVLTSLSPISGDHMLFEGIYAALVAFVLAFTLEYQFPLLTWLTPVDWPRLANFAIYMVMAVLLMKSKLFLIGLVSSLFRIKMLSSVHYFTYFRLSLLIALVGFVASVFIDPFIELPSGFQKEVLNNLLVLLFLARLITVALVLNNKHTFRKLHLFFYLCTTELFPLVIIIKVFLK